MYKKEIVLGLIICMSIFLGFLYGGIYVNKGIYEGVKKADAIMRSGDRLVCTIKY